MTMSTGRAASEPPNTSPYTSTPTRGRPGPSILSPLATSSPNDPYRSTNYQHSVISHGSLPTLSRYLPTSSSVDGGTGTAPFSAAASQAGSIATTANPNTSHRFSRGHARRKQPGAHHAVPRGGDPDALDLMALEEPDEVFRLFGVRDVRKLERKASDAAAAKVAELRSMVGERYRDLLAAADSIVRMRAAAEKLVDRLDVVDDAVRGAGAAIQDTPTKSLASRRFSQRPASPSRQRTLSSAPTLSLTIHLLLSIPSLVHAHLESSDFLSAARLESLGQAVHHELSHFEPEDDAEVLMDVAGQPKSLMEAFPIVAKQQEALDALKPLILRRALADLRDWEADTATTARTLAAITLLQGSTSSPALRTLLSARSEVLSSIINAPSSSRADTSAVTSSLQRVLGLVLRTVEGVTATFGADDGTAEGSLSRLLREVERPSLLEITAPDGPETNALAPILTTLPNYATLSRHLPLSLLTFTPSLSDSDAANVLATTESVSSEIVSWTSDAINLIDSGVESWIAALTSSPSTGAKLLSHLRTTLFQTLSSPPSQSSASSVSCSNLLLSRLSRTLESRLEQVYTAQLSSLVERVQPSLEALLLALPGDDATNDRDPIKWLFEAPFEFPSSSSSSSSSTTADASFELFLGNVQKRVGARSPLVDRGVGELERAAREVRADLDEWFGSGSGFGFGSGSAASTPPFTVASADEGDADTRLKGDYVQAARRAFEGVAERLEQVLGEVEGEVDAALFVSNFIGGLVSSGEFARGLLLGAVGESGQSPERAILESWYDRLSALQERSLGAWRDEAVKQALRRVEEGMNEAAVGGFAAWAWDASRASNLDSSALPSAPSPALLAALHSLTSSLHRLPLTRTSDRATSRALLLAFSADAATVAVDFAAKLESLLGSEERGERIRETSAQAAWDVRMVSEIVELAGGESASQKQWEELEERFLRVAAPSVSADLSSLRETLSSSTHLYLQRTQSIFAPLLPSFPSATASANGATKPISFSLQRLLPLGPPPSSTTSSATAVGTLTPGLVKPGPRLGLLPTRG
ncbi:hypothetical protein JCM11641_002148 [Rhodosporidiobolus odoratus]